MKYKYFDINGLLIPSDRIIASLHQLEITEDELEGYLGAKRMMTHGYVLSHLETMVGQDNWYLHAEHKHKCNYS